MSFLQSIAKTSFNTASRVYKGIVASRLQAYGLKYNDLFVESEDVLKAMSRMDAQDKIDRERRIKRAFDASLKKKVVPPENYNPYDLYLQKKLVTANYERTEKTLLDA